jgi:LmbE family N-acetylglucosaminyl deacetylase
MLRRIKNFVANYLLARRSYRFFIREWTALGDLERAADAMRTMRFSRILSPEVSDASRCRRIAVLAPHPDDETIGPGGTLIQARGAGSEILVITLTGSGPDSERRKAESMAVAGDLGFRTSYLDWNEGDIPIGADSRVDALVALLDDFRPDAVFVSFCLDDHPDHRRASELLASIASRLPRALEVWAYQVYSVLPPNIIVDITSVAARKAGAIRLYTSQMSHRDWAHYALGLNAFMSRFLPPGPQERYAEGFFVLPIEDYAEVCNSYFRKP